MSEKHNAYVNPLCQRYASDEMKYNFSEDKKFKIWRRLWVALAETEMELGLPITEEQVEELRSNMNNINFDDAEVLENKLRHDVMAHIHAYGMQCPKAKPIIHLGATSCDIGDNADIILMNHGLKIILKKLVNCIKLLADFSMQYKDMPTLGFTHFQPAQLTTVGKRASLWLHDLFLDYNELINKLANLKLRGIKGTTGTQASFMSLFENNENDVLILENSIVRKLGFNESYPVTGQTYSRKIDFQVLQVLSGIAQSASKFSQDMRLLSSLKEIEEPYESDQIGSSAMAYKRNPMRSERLSSLARFVLTCEINPAITASTQWFERTLDDSANRRIVIPQAFLAVDSILNIYMNILEGIVVYPSMIEKHLRDELPFMITENILMRAVKKGGDRQELHEKIRRYSFEAGKRIKEQGLENNLIDLIAYDGAFDLFEEDFEDLLDPYAYTGRSGSQVVDFIEVHINPIIAEYSKWLNVKSSVKV